MSPRRRQILQAVLLAPQRRIATRHCRQPKSVRSAGLDHRRAGSPFRERRSRTNELANDADLLAVDALEGADHHRMTRRVADDLLSSFSISRDRSYGFCPRPADPRPAASRCGPSGRTVTVADSSGLRQTTMSVSRTGSCSGDPAFRRTSGAGGWRPMLPQPDRVPTAITDASSKAAARQTARFDPPREILS